MPVFDGPEYTGVERLERCMDERRTRRDFLGTVSAAGAAALAGCSDALSGAAETTRSPESTAATDTPNASSPEEFEDAFVELYDRTVGSVVAIRVPGGGLGSGFVYEGNHVVTNYHVVTDADTVEVQYARGQSVTGRIVGTDRHSDLAVVRAERRPGYASPLPLHTAEPEIGTPAAAIGSPYGLEGSMTSGIVSGVNRLVPSPSADFRIPNTIQTDVPVNPGNSGGPLVNLNEEVLGVVNSGGGDNIAFAISAALVERVVPAIIQTGEYNHPFVGVDLVDVTPAVAEANGLQRTDGVLVTKVVENTSAAGILQGSTGTERVNGFTVPTGGDVILSIGGRQIESPREFLSYLELQGSPGETVQLTIIRDGRKRTVSVELSSRERVR